MGEPRDGMSATADRALRLSQGEHGLWDCPLLAQISPSKIAGLDHRASGPTLGRAGTRFRRVLARYRGIGWHHADERPQRRAGLAEGESGSRCRMRSNTSPLASPVESPQPRPPWLTMMISPSPRRHFSDRRVLSRLSSFHPASCSSRAAQLTPLRSRSSSASFGISALRNRAGPGWALPCPLHFRTDRRTAAKPERGKGKPAQPGRPRTAPCRAPGASGTAPSLLVLMPEAVPDFANGRIPRAAWAAHSAGLFLGPGPTSPVRSLHMRRRSDPNQQPLAPSRPTAPRPRSARGTPSASNRRIQADSDSRRQ